MAQVVQQGAEQVAAAANVPYDKATSSLDLTPGQIHLNQLVEQQVMVRRAFAADLKDFLGGSSLPTTGGHTLPKGGPMPPRRGGGTLPNEGNDKYYSTGLKKKIDQLTKPPGTIDGLP